MSIKDEIEKQRREKDKFFRLDPRSPIPAFGRKEFDGLNYYAINKEFRFELDLHEHEKRKIVEIDNSKGGVQQYLRWGEFRFEIDGQECFLQAYKSDRKEPRLWIPFKDETNGPETYEAGRYIDLEASRHEKNGKWILDFNKAYNPSCVYNEKYVCPLIPPENWLRVSVEAGEKNYKGG